MWKAGETLVKEGRTKVSAGGAGHVLHGTMETAACCTVSLSMCGPNVLEGTEGICVGAGQAVERDLANAREPHKGG